MPPFSLGSNTTSAYTVGSQVEINSKDPSLHQIIAAVNSTLLGHVNRITEQIRNRVYEPTQEYTPELWASGFPPNPPPY